MSNFSALIFKGNMSNFSALYFNFWLAKNQNSGKLFITHHP